MKCAIIGVLLKWMQTIARVRLTQFKNPDHRFPLSSGVQIDR
jgi:hypothetical protein